MMMTNRLLATVLAVFVSGALTAHASQDVHVTFNPPVKPSSLRTVLHQVEATATSAAITAIDPAAGIRAAYQRDHDTLEHLRQEGSALKSPTHAQFNQLISADQAQLLALEKAALDQLAAGASVNATAVIAQMDAIPSQARAALTQYESQAAKTSGNGHKP